VGIFTRLFGRRPAQTDAGEEQGPADAPPGNEAAAAPEASSAAAQTAAPVPPETPRGPDRPPIPLHSLEAYRRDPAFQNFMDKVRRPPGVRPGRPRGPQDPEDAPER